MNETKKKRGGRPSIDQNLKHKHRIFLKLEEPVYDSFVSLCEKNQLGMNTLLRSLIIDQLIKESSHASADTL